MSALPAIQLRLPINYQAAKRALIECEHVDECRDWANRAEAMATYAHLARDEQMELIARRVRLRAIARAGELLLSIPNNYRGLHLTSNQGSKPNPQSRAGVGRAAGMRPQDVTQALAIARVPLDVRELLIESTDPPPPSRLATHPGRIRPRPVRLDRFTPGPAYREMFIHAGGLCAFVSFLKRHPPADYLRELAPDETERARRYLDRIETWLAAARACFPPPRRFP